MEKVKLIIDNSINKIIMDTANDDKIKDLEKRHERKTHFIPKRYRVFNGLLQSMNIKFVDFIELLFQEIVKHSKYYILDELSGLSSGKFKISVINDNLVDEYITRRQTISSSDMELESDFNLLLEEINKNCIENQSKLQDEYELSHDIDLFFKDEKNNYFYAEIKYNDDHDTGKFIDINRKFIKTYSYLYEKLLIRYGYDRDRFTLKPCLFFFNNQRKIGNIYVPESTNIYRGEEIFEEFFKDIKYKDIDNYLINISENPKTVKKFDDLYNKVMKI